jgi:hypothetical protein
VNGGQGDGSRGVFPTICVAHRGNVVEEVVTGALKVTGRLDGLATAVERMENRSMSKDEQLGFAQAALALRFPDAAESSMAATQLLTCRRVQDVHREEIYERIKAEKRASNVPR